MSVDREFLCWYCVVLFVIFACGPKREYCRSLRVMDIVLILLAEN